jgi:hypothetical protein
VYCIERGSCGSVGSSVSIDGKVTANDGWTDPVGYNEIHDICGVSIWIDYWSQKYIYGKIES